MCECSGTAVSFASVIQPILTTNCTASGCHAGNMPKEGLDLSSGKAYGALVGVASSQCNNGLKRVLPGDPAKSYLVDKLLGTNLCSGSQMPKAGTSIPAKDLEAITNWICNGAPNN
jgi:hypothetical protein